MQEGIFISNSINKAIELYINNKNKEYTADFNTFLCVVFRMLVIIYGEDELISAFNENNSEKFDNCLMKYGLEVEKLDEFKVNFEKYYKLTEKQVQKAIKKKNKFFNIVQKNIIDMIILKKQKNMTNQEELNSFYDLLFTANTKDFYRKSIAVLEAYNPYEIDEYAKKQLMEAGE